MDDDKIGARLRALRNTAMRWLEDRDREYFKARNVVDLFEQYALLRDDLRLKHPSLFEDLPVREPPSRYGPPLALLVKAILPNVSIPGNIARGDLDVLTKDIGRCLDLLSELEERHADAMKPDLFRKRGDIWHIRYEGLQITLQDAKGLLYIAHLLGHPQRAFRVTELILVDPGHTLTTEAELYGGMTQEQLQEDGLIRLDDLGDSDAILDDRAVRDYESQLKQLERKLQEASDKGDIATAVTLRREMAAIKRQLRANRALGRRVRKAMNNVERARQAVSKAVNRSLKRIRKNHQSLGLHLSRSIKLGMTCSYEPENETHWIT